MDQMTSAAKPDPWLAQKVRFRAQGKENEPMRKKVPAGLVIVLAIMFLMTAVAAAVTNGFGLLRYYPEQAENTAFTDRIVSIGIITGLTRPIQMTGLHRKCKWNLAQYKYCDEKNNANCF